MAMIRSGIMRREAVVCFVHILQLVLSISTNGRDTHLQSLIVVSRSSRRETESDVGRQLTRPMQCMHERAQMCSVSNFVA